ncbi:MAG: hypothetical protein L0287_07350 [Anaerolineae bacterium]|nr:hypothetical protein [Anaerolineae bacterium]MCI0609791.1 hypothetical protein [Anaerolineae bacterium]
MTTKTCTKCGITKDENGFSWERPGRKHAACNECRAKYQAEYYKNNKDKELKYKAKRQIERREEDRVFIFTYLSQHPCVDCGESDPMVLSFDHVRGLKRMAISQMVNQGYSIEALQEEIDKCEVRCMNCHMRKEKERRGTIYPSI